MKKQINPSIKAHLIRSSFYVLLLLAVCVIPFALAQRNTTRRAVAKPKMAATAKHATSAATSQHRNDVTAAVKGAALKGKSTAVASTHFTNAFGRRPGAVSPNGTGACWYDFTAGTASFVPGVTDLFLDCDDCGVDVPLPFSVNLYGQSFSTVHVGSNGHATFGTPQDGFGITCPPPFGISGSTEALAPFWGDQTVFEADSHGVFTTTTGSSPNRVFYIEWRSKYFGSPDELDYEVALNENGTPPFSFIYNTINTASTGNDSQLVVGQKFDETCFTVFGCDTTGGTAPPVSSGQVLDAVAAATPPPPTPTPTPGGGCTVTGSIDAGDATQTDRMFRDGVPSTCAAPKTCPGPFGDGLQHHYDSYTYTNTTGTTQCVTVDPTTECVGTNYTFVVAYLGSFNPADICENYLADSGSSPDPTQPPVTFSFNVDDGQTFVIVVSEVTADAGCPAYTLNITPEAICGGTGGACSLQPWTIVANYPMAIESAAVCTDGTLMYAGGGFDPNLGGPTNAFNSYDGSTWTALATLPSNIYDARSVYAANTNSIYFFGGIDSSFTVSNIVQVYDVSSGTWHAGAPMPGNRFFPAAVYYDPTGLIYVAGGIDESFLETSTTWIYDPVLDVWDSITGLPMPVAMGGSAVSLVGENMYLQGSFGSGATNLNYAYDVLLNTWTQKANMPAATYEAAGGAIGTNTYVVGGGDPATAPGSIKANGKGAKGPRGSMARPDTSFNTTFVYDTVADTWSTGPNTNVAHSFTGGTAVGNDMYVVCGFDGVTGDTNTVEKSHCGEGGITPTPTPTPGTPTPTPTPGGSCPPVITESSTQVIVDGNSVSCNSGGITTQNSYWRAFNMGTFTGGLDYNITALEFAIEQASGGTGSQTATLNLYANHGSAFPNGDWQSNLIVSVPITIPDQNDTIFVAPVTAIAPGSALELVMELNIPDGSAQGNVFFVGSNTDPESAPSYLSAPDCGVTVPTPTGDLGFPDMHIVFNVDGSCPGTPTPTPGTPTPTPGTPTPTPPPPTPTPTPTPTSPTPTPTPRVSPTPRPRPTPHPRPTPP